MTPTPEEIIRAIETAAGFEGIGGIGVPTVSVVARNDYGLFSIDINVIDDDADVNLIGYALFVRDQSGKVGRGSIGVLDAHTMRIVDSPSNWVAITALLNHLIKLRDGGAERIAARATEMLRGKELNHE